ncbi:MAG: co-chaperone YbbN [Parvularculaceae bacterium]|jgi:putative thioredoxin|nr:co-chaperone YbbN [Parvularculaceae bacterium]
MTELIGGGAPNGAAGAAAKDLIKDATIETFEADVLRASMKTPVIVDFWADWCQPCKQLTPRLEKAVREAKGKVRLVKVDIDRNKMLASQLRIQSIPTVYAFFQGRPVDAFQGAVPDSEIKAFIQRLVGAGAGDAAGDLSEHLDAAEQMLAQGDIAGAADLFGRIAEADQGNVRALAGLARCHVALRDFDQARALLDMIPADKQSDPAVTSLRAQLELAAGESGKRDAAELQARLQRNPKDYEARFELAGALIGAGDMERGVDELLEIVAKNRDWNEGAARKKLLTVFEALGAAHPVTQSGRRRLSSILFS